MKTIALAVAIAAILGCTASGTLYVDSFHADLELSSAGELRVVETITVAYLSPHHGIERWIPASYRTSIGTRVTIDLEVVSVTMDGRPVPSSRRTSSGNLVLRIGDAALTVIDTHTYEIEYTASRVLLFRDDYLQLYWNVTGTEWELPIRSATATLLLPPEVSLDLVSAISYAGAWGSSDSGSPVQRDASGRLTFSAGPLNPGSGLTIDVAIPRSAMPARPPSFGEKVGRFLRENLLALLPLATLFLMLVLWTRLGRDPSKGTVAPSFEPPTGVGPAAAGVLIDDRIDLRDISALVIGLAVSGHLTIREETPESDSLAEKARAWVGGASRRYTFVRGRRSPEDLSPAERTLYDAIFPDAESNETPLSSLENRFYKHLPTLRVRLYDELIEKRFYVHNPERVRKSYAGWGTSLLAAGFGLGLVLGSIYLGAALAVSGLIVLAFSPIMPRKTRSGATALADVLGLAEYIQRAEKDRIEFSDAPEKSPQHFEQLLPYAVALGLTAIWVEKFENLLREPPQWYSGGSTFSGHVFASSLSRLSAGMQSTFVSAPRTAPSGRSAWGGRSSFGGGFSGGGFGGGGGRGW
ncbi:MAG: DUF2207 domain-containing protein [Candidatus Bipolaricaulota bacterium]